MIAGAYSIVGRDSEINQDALLVATALGLFIVADGMGGQRGGEIASSVAVETISAELREGIRSKHSHPAGQLVEAIRLANRRVREMALASADLGGMGTTVVVALCDEHRAHIAHLGDSRAYLLRQGRLRRLTEDHSVVSELIEQGRLSPDAARRHSLRHMITRYLGCTDGVDVDVQCVPCQLGDGILLCSDGLTNVMEDGDLESIFASDNGAAEPRETCVRLIGTARDRGARDDVTALLVQFSEGARHQHPTHADAGGQTPT